MQFLLVRQRIILQPGAAFGKRSSARSNESNRFSKLRRFVDAVYDALYDQRLFQTRARITSVKNSAGKVRKYPKKTTTA
jgi:hypothetical protein